MKWVFRSRTIGTTMSLWDTLDNATYPTTGAKYLELKTKVMWGNVCLIPLSTVKHYAGTTWRYGVWSQYTGKIGISLSPDLIKTVCPWQYCTFPVMPFITDLSLHLRIWNNVLFKFETYVKMTWNTARCYEKIIQKHKLV